MIDESGDAFCGGQGVVESVNGGSYFNGDNRMGAGATWAIDSPDRRTVTMQWQFANGGSAARTASLTLNDTVVAPLTFAPTTDWSTWEIQSQSVTLEAGSNVVRLQASTADGLPNIDWLSVSTAGIQPGVCASEASACADIGLDENNVDMAALMSCRGNPAVCSLGRDSGHFDVAMAFDSAYTGELEVHAESRRNMVYSSAGDGTTRCVAFTVNVRDPEGQPIQDVDRGQPGLNLRIAQGTSALQALTVKAASNPVVLYIAGDSTVADQEPQLNLPAQSRFSGWGQYIPAFFNRGISVANYADSGEGTAAFRPDGGGLWNRINTPLKTGDWVFIQLGHNDKTTSAAVYRSRVRAMIAGIKAKGAHPVLITPMVRNTNEPLNRQHIYGDLNVRAVLTELSSSERVPLIDLMQLSSEWALRQGQSAAQAYFVNNDRTHTNERGAKLFAEMIVQEIQRQDLGLEPHLR